MVLPYGIKKAPNLLDGRMIKLTAGKKDLGLLVASLMKTVTRHLYASVLLSYPPLTMGEKAATAKEDVAF